MATNKRIVIEYDINGKPIDVAIDKTLNLQQKVKELTKALRSVKEGSAEFKILSTALGDAQDQLQKAGIKSRDLLGSLQLIPGPVGQIASELNGAISLLKLFSSFSLKDIQFQFRETVNDVKDIFTNLFGASEGFKDVADSTEKSTETTKEYSKETKDLNQKLEDNADAGANVNRTIEKQVELQSKLFSILPDGTRQYVQLSEANKKIYKNIFDLNRVEQEYQITQNEGIFQIGKRGEATRKLSEDEMEAVTSGKKLLLTTDGVVTAMPGATAATRGFGQALRTLGVSATAAATAVGVLEAALMALGIGAVIAAIVALGTALYELAAAQIKVVKGFFAMDESMKDFADSAKKGNQELQSAFNNVLQVRTAFEQARKGVISKRQALDEYNKVLGGTIGQAETLAEAERLYNANTENYIKAVGLRAQATELFAIAARKSAESSSMSEVGFWDMDRRLFKDRDEELQDRKKKLSTEAGKSRELAQKLLAEALKLETGYKPKIEKKETTTVKGKTEAELAKERYNLSLKELDALIKLEIDKTKTREDILDGYLKKRKEIQIEIAKLDKQPLSSAEVAVIEAENRQKLLDAIIEDNVRVIQAEIDKNNRLATEAGIGTKQYFDARREVARTEFEKEFEEARKDEKTRETKQENARTNYWKKLLDIDKEGLQALAAERQIDFDSETQNSQDFFNRQRDLEMANYAVRQADARDNYDKLELLKQEHEKKMRDIDVEEIQYQADIYGRKAKVQQEIGQKDQKYTIESLFTKNNAIRKLNEERFDNEIREENNSYEAKKLAATGNVKELETIEYEHAATLREIGVRKKEANQQVLREITQVTAQFGQTLGQIGDAIMQDQQGRDKKKFEMGKKIAIAGIGIEKAAAIASIWSNNAIANAKAVAAFPLVAGQPWVTINTVSAALSTAATIAAAIQAISQINGTSFEGGDAGSGAQSNLLGRNYEKGGYIKGPRHAQGGVMLEAEGGEAIMTRGAVTMFAPLLSAMNQMGGGTAFTNGAVGQAANDNPTRSNPAGEQSPIIMKTYVVSKDMQTDMERENRLKNLSTL